MKLYQRLQTPSIPGWVLLPLRLFLGITFVYAGIQKLTDPQYFNPAAPGYIGRQITSFANGSPIHGFLLQFVVPHSHLFGALVAYGEIAIGLGALFGFLLRPAAFFGLLLSLMFFLSASWRVHPYFYGSDIVFIFCWLTLLLNGPTHTGLPTLDVFLASWFIQQLPPHRQVEVAHILAILLGTASLSPEVSSLPTASTPVQAPGSKQTSLQGTGRQTSQQQRGRQAIVKRSQQQKTRRSFILGMFTGGIAMFGLSLFGFTVLRYGRDDAAVSPSNSTTGSNATGTSDQNSGNTSPQGTPTSSSTPGTIIAQASSVPVNSAITFTIASNGDTGVLVHLNSGQFVAYDATCTHAGCQVDYDPGSQLLVCPCHGAAFDPTQSGAVVQPPARIPLTSVTIHIDSSGNIATQ